MIYKISYTLHPNQTMLYMILSAIYYIFVNLYSTISVVGTIIFVINAILASQDQATLPVVGVDSKKMWDMVYNGAKNGTEYLIQNKDQILNAIPHVLSTLTPTINVNLRKDGFEEPENELSDDVDDASEASEE